MNLRSYIESERLLHVGTRPEHAYFLPRDEGDALSLNGEWRFEYFSTVDEVPDAAFLPDYCPSASIPVPSAWQMHGWDHHQYVDELYPFPFDPPYLPAENPAGLYQRSFRVDAPRGRFFLRFDGADSCLFAFLNGAFLGFSQVAHGTSEFEVTDALRAGENTLTVLVVKWCFGSYLEDQDKFRMSGLFRDVTLIRRPRDFVRDLRVETEEAPGGARVQVEAAYDGAPFDIALTLRAPGGEIARQETFRGSVSFTLESPSLWTAETPFLYDLLLECPGETIAEKIGVRFVRVENGRVLLNGQPLRLRGVNRHDSEPLLGPAVTRETVLRDLTLMKRANVNAIRASHYPPPPYLPALCDEMGFYLIDEADLECHGASHAAGHGDAVPSENDKECWAFFMRGARWRAAVLDRVEKLVRRDRNRPCVLIWSLGNESGYGETTIEAARWVKAEDPSRLVHYEGAYYMPEKMDTSPIDLYSRMYVAVPDWDALCADARIHKPRLLCEYAHAMGNGPGDLEDYERVFQARPNCLGGFVWEWCDHAVPIGFAADGRARYRYGGDFGETPHNGNFCMDGLVRPDRTDTGSLAELRQVFRPARAALVPGGLQIRNLLDFLPLSAAVSIRWELSHDESVIGEGILETPPLPARGQAVCALPFDVPLEGTLRLRLRYLAKAGVFASVPEDAELGFDQLTLCEQKTGLPPLCAGNVTVTQEDCVFVVAGTGFRYRFDRRLGAPCSLERDGREWLRRPMEYNVWRAPTDNDRKIRLLWQDAGYDRLQTCVRESEAQEENGLATIRFRISLAAVSYLPAVRLEAVYRVDARGALDVSVHAERCADMPFLPRLGLRMFLPERFAQAEYEGYGPCECYEDKRQAAWYGRFPLRADAECPYIKPQEYGARFGCARLRLDDGQTALCVRSERPFTFSALPYTQEELTRKPHWDELEKCDDTVLCLDYRQSGIGSGSCGPCLLPAYRLDETTFDYALRLSFEAV